MDSTLDVSQDLEGGDAERRLVEVAEMDALKGERNLQGTTIVQTQQHHKREQFLVDGFLDEISVSALVQHLR